VARIAACAADLFFAAKIRETLRSAGHEVTLVSDPAAASPETADALVVELSGDEQQPIRLPEGVPALGFYSHVDAKARRRAEDTGFAIVVPRSRMAREMPALVSKLVAE
jgi:hypothetical protein